MKRQWFIWVLAIMLLGSCATLVTGTRDGIHVSSFPQGASVIVHGEIAGTTPLTLKMKRSLKKQRIEVKHDELGSKEIILSRKFNGWTIPSIFTLIGPVVDIASGAIMKYDQKYYEVNFQENEAIQGNTYDYFYVITNKGDTFYILPDETFPFYNSPSVKTAEFTLLDGKEAHFSISELFAVKNIYQSKTRIVLFQTSLQYEEKTYEIRQVETTAGVEKLLLEVLLKNDEYTLLTITDGAYLYNNTLVSGPYEAKNFFFVFKGKEQIGVYKKIKEIPAFEEKFKIPGGGGQFQSYEKQYLKKYQDLVN